MRRLSKIYRFLLLLLPVVIYFSYFPVISLGSDTTMNFELSIPLVWLVVFDIVAVVILVLRKKLSLLFKKWAFLLFPFFASLSIIWSSNVLRGVLTVGIMWAIYIAVFAMVVLRDEVMDEKFRRVALKVFFGASLAVCFWCLLQCILDVAGVPRECTLMCEGCVSLMFGFPHPNGFAIEPQFMGNLLLAPTIVTGAILTTTCPSDTLRAAQAKSSRSVEHIVIKIAPLFFVFTVTLFLTFSRGAIYAFIVAMLFMSAFMLVRAKKIGEEKTWKKIGVTWLVVVLSFVFTLNLQGILAEVGPTNDTYGSAVAKVLNHLSLGIIDVRDKRVEVPVDDSPVLVASESLVEVSEDAVFDGYVEESTEVRSRMTSYALTLWSSNFKNVMVGVGIGGAGKALYEAGLIDNVNEIVQNEYASVLLETGLIGVVILVLLVVFVIMAIVNNPGLIGISSLLLTLLVAYGVSLLFFSGFANALQIYLMPVFLAVMLGWREISL